MAQMEDELNTKEIKGLYEAILSLENTDEAKKFLRDVCTFSELKAIAERFRVAKLVRSEVPYREISQKTGASTATVTRVAHWYHHGMGGYKLVFDRMKK